MRLWLVSWSWSCSCSVSVTLALVTIFWSDLSSKNGSGVTSTHAFSGIDPQSSNNAVRVLVTGAAGKTGRLILSKLEQDYRYEPKGLVRNERSARNIVRSDDTRCPLEHVVIADITSPTFIEDFNSNNNNGLKNLDAMIICTSSVPRIRKRSLAAMLLKAPWRMIRGYPAVDFKSMRFAWKYGGYPEKVDYHGQKAQIDLAKRLGIPHVILVSSMGGTDPNNFLNSVGKRTTKSSSISSKSASSKDEGHGDILLWKRRAEKYLVESGLDYTILHPGGLVGDTPGGQEEFVLDVDDNLYRMDCLNHDHENPHSNSKNRQSHRSMTRISREDVAELCVAALSAGKGEKISFDCITLPSSTVSSLKTIVTATTDKIDSSDDEGVGANAGNGRTIKNSMDTSTSTAPSTTMAATTTASATSVTTTIGRKSAEETLTEFLELSITTNYDI
ncbi:NAD(P)-binding protein [Fragilariopsis cylindrus CCMP1102]|uniref:NAD(P)-binding protein n=1 Tax=Fragilariopsis cylindrus CCMP1102 TaxID=635003 RepID=A0A1E7ENN6_9STRA|nr:NAD(P)-binding protein [Fragilariopsis cylindrus CCMP1102]|eukprot:OEU07560.1 NAD(P)-binding protein [Fragilariopsis cylindrus CCMP1102]